MSKKHPAPKPCQSCGKPSAARGSFCASCYGGVLHPDGKPLEPGTPGDPWHEFNAEADAYVLDRQMPPANQVEGIILLNASRRRNRCN